MRVGVWIAAFLNAQRYHCIEAEALSVKAVLQYEIPLHGLIRKDPQIIHSNSFDVSHFEGVMFDRVLIHAVDIHLNAGQSDSLFAKLALKVRPGGQVFISHNLPKAMRIGHLAFQEKYGFTMTGQFLVPCQLYDCLEGTCLNKEVCPKGFSGYFWAFFTKV